MYGDYAKQYSSVIPITSGNITDYIIEEVSFEKKANVT